MVYFPGSLVWAMVLGASVTTSSEQSKTKLYENSAKIVPSFLLSSNKVKGSEWTDAIKLLNISKLIKWTQILTSTTAAYELLSFWKVNVYVRYFGYWLS